MTKWRMEAVSVSGVLSKTGAAHKDLLGSVDEEAVRGVFTDLAWGGSVTAHVPEALGAVLEEQLGSVRRIVNHVEAGILGVGNAAAQLKQGDQEMASRFQAEMLASAATGDFKFFEGRG